MYGELVECVEHSGSADRTQSTGRRCDSADTEQRSRSRPVTRGRRITTGGVNHRSTGPTNDRRRPTAAAGSLNCHGPGSGRLCCVFRGNTKCLSATISSPWYNRHTVVSFHRAAISTSSGRASAHQPCFHLCIVSPLLPKARFIRSVSSASPRPLCERPERGTVTPRPASGPRRNGRTGL